MCQSGDDVCYSCLVRKPSQMESAGVCAFAFFAIGEVDDQWCDGRGDVSDGSAG